MAVHVVSPGSAELDASNAADFAARLGAFPADDHLVVDLEGVTFCDSTGMGALVASWKRQREGGGSLTIANLAEPLLRWFSATGLVEALMPEVAAGHG